MIVHLSSQYHGNGKFHPYACINERSAKNKIFEVLAVREEKFRATIAIKSSNKCSSECDEFAFILSSTADQNNCYCIGDPTKRNTSLVIHPSDIIPQKVEFNSWLCYGGMLLQCRIEEEFNWCSLLDQGLSHYDFLNVYRHPDLFYKNWYPKCLTHDSFQHGTLHKNKTVDGPFAHHECQSLCHSEQYFILQVRILG